MLSIFSYTYWPSVGEGNGTPLQYSCLENPWTEEPGRLQSMGSRRVRPDWATSLSLFTFMHWRRKWQPTPVFLGEFQGQRSLMGCCRWGSHRVGHDWSDLAAIRCATVDSPAQLPAIHLLDVPQASQTQFDSICQYASNSTHYIFPKISFCFFLFLLGYSQHDTLKFKQKS